MYEIDGIKFTKEELEVRAKELGITFEELLAKNSELIKQVGKMAVCWVIGKLQPQHSGLHSYFGIKIFES